MYVLRSVGALVFENKLMIVGYILGILITVNLSIIHQVLLLCVVLAILILLLLFISHLDRKSDEFKKESA